MISVKPSLVTKLAKHDSPDVESHGLQGSLL
jgi:hypothetical protein